MSDQRPYAALLAKGEDRKQRIVAVAQRLLTQNGWRGTTLGQIARGAGISTAGLLHHFESKEQLLHAVLDARDSYDLRLHNLLGAPVAGADDLNVDPLADLPEQIEKVAERFRRAPELVGMFVILLIENLDPDAPLRERLLDRYRGALDLIAGAIRRGQRAGRYRADLDPRVKAVEIVAFLNGLETSWLLDSSIPVTEVFKEYSRSLAGQITLPSKTP